MEKSGREAVIAMVLNVGGDLRTPGSFWTGTELERKSGGV